jgi:thiol-disulfide isomerase/thioredoxin
MKNISKHIALIFVFSIIFSGLTACTNTANTQKGPIIEGADMNVNSAAPEMKGENYPPASAAMMQNQIKDLEGGTYTLQDKKGKVVLINLWATWCQPCRHEMPALVEMQDKYRDKNFEVLGLNVDDEEVDKIQSFAQEMKLNYPLGYADTKMVSEFIKLSRQSGIPQSVLIDREGRVTGVFFGVSARAINNMKEAVEKVVN